MNAAIRSKLLSPYLVLIIVSISAILHWRVFGMEIRGYNDWRQTLTQTEVYNFVDEDFNILNARTNNRPETGRILRLEFPLMQWSFAAAHKLFNTKNIVISRFLSFLIGCFSIWGMFSLGRVLFRHSCGAAIMGEDNRGKGTMSGPTKVQMDYDQLDLFVKGTSKDLNQRTYGYGMNFLHELGHTDFGGDKNDWVPGNTSAPGSNLRQMNKIRKELSKSLGTKFGKRVSYENTGIGNDMYFPFSRKSQTILKRGDVPTGGFVVIPIPKSK